MAGTQTAESVKSKTPVELLWTLKVLWDWRDNPSRLAGKEAADSDFKLVYEELKTRLRDT